MKKLALFGALVVMLMTSCSSMRIVDQNAAVNAGAAAVQALTISDAQVAQLCSQYMAETDGQNTILPADNSYTQRLNRIMARFHNISNLNLNYKVYQSNTVNAFALESVIRIYESNNFVIAAGIAVESAFCGECRFACAVDNHVFKQRIHVHIAVLQVKRFYHKS